MAIRAVAAVGLLSGGSAPAHAGCGRPELTVRIEASAGPLALKEDYSAQELRNLAGDMAQAPPHPILGFYIASTGYQLTVGPRSGRPCDGFEVAVRLVSTGRMIEIASDLQRTPCKLKAALDHYHRHEAAQIKALAEATGKLQSTLQVYLDGHGETDQIKIKSSVSGFMTRWLNQYESGVRALRNAVDTPGEVSALMHACET